MGLGEWKRDTRWYATLATVSDAASGWAGWALAHPEFGSSVNPITTRGADYAHHITASPPGFENPAASPSGIVFSKYIPNCNSSLQLTWT